MKQSDRERMRALALFRTMDEARFDALMAAAHVRRYPAHAKLIEAGERPQLLHVLLDGLLEYFVEGGGRHSTLFIVKAVAACMLPAVIDDLPHLGSGRTLTEAECLHVPADAFRAALADDGPFARAVLAELARHHRERVRILENFKLRGGVERLAAFLLDADAEGGGTGRIELPFEKRRLASLLGMSPENLSRALSALTANAVEVRGRAIRIRDRDALIETAQIRLPIDDPTL